MSVGAIGNTIFINQMTANVSSIQNSHNNRIELQNFMAQMAVNEKDEKVLKIRPTEDNQEVDPDREHNKNEAEQKNNKIKKKDKEDKLNKNKNSLDIKV